MSSNSSGYRVRRHLSFVDLPYRGQSFYLDIKAASVKSRICERILTLGGQIETFLTKELSLLITDRDTEKTPTAKQLGLKNHTIPLSRGQALLQKAAENHQPDSGTSHDILQSASNLGVKTQTASLFFRTTTKLLSKIKKEKKTTGQDNDPLCGMSSICWDKDKENVYTIKVEDNDGLYRPLFKQFDIAPTINYNETGSPFDVGVVLVKQNENNQSKKKTATGAVKGGYCESCDHWYKCTLREHLNSTKHNEFVSSLDNFKSLDNISSQLPSLDGFLTRYGLPCDLSFKSSSLILEESQNQNQPFSSAQDTVINSEVYGDKRRTSIADSQLKQHAEGNSSNELATKVYQMTSDKISLESQLLNQKPLVSTPTASTKLYQEHSGKVLTSVDCDISKTHSELMLQNGSNLEKQSSQSGVDNSIRHVHGHRQLSRVHSVSRESSAHSDRRITVDDVLKSVFDDVTVDDDNEDDLEMMDVDLECDIVNSAVGFSGDISATKANQKSVGPAVIPTDSNSATNQYVKAADTSERCVIGVPSSHSDRKINNIRHSAGQFLHEAAFSSSCSFGDMGVGNVISFLQSNDSRGSGDRVGRSAAESYSVESFKGKSAGSEGVLRLQSDLSVDKSVCRQVVRTSDNLQSQSLGVLDRLTEDRSVSSSHHNFELENKLLDQSLCSENQSQRTARYSLSNEDCQSVGHVNGDIQTIDTQDNNFMKSSDSNIDKNSLHLISVQEASLNVNHIAKPVNICNPDYSNITEESTCQEFPKLIDSLRSLNSASQSPTMKRTPQRSQSNSLRKQILTNVTNSGSTVRNWLLPQEETASDVSILSEDIGNTTLVEIAEDIGSNQGTLDNVETGSSAGMVADWIKNQSFDAVSKHEDVEFHGSKLQENYLSKPDEINDIENKDVITQHLHTSYECTELEMGIEEVDSYLDASSKPSDWSEGTSISDCTLSKFRLTHNITETVTDECREVGTVMGVEQAHSQAVLESLSVKSGVSANTELSMNSGLSSSVTERGIKIKGLLKYRNNTKDGRSVHVDQGSRSFVHGGQYSQVHPSVESVSNTELIGKASCSQSSSQVMAPTVGCHVSDTRRVICMNNSSSVSSVTSNHSSKMNDPQILTDIDGGKQYINGKKAKNKVKIKKPKTKSKTLSKTLEQHVNSPNSLADGQKQSLLSQQAYSPISMPSEGISRFQYGSAIPDCPSAQLPYNPSVSAGFQTLQTVPQQPHSTHQPSSSQYTHTGLVAGQHSNFLQSMSTNQLNNISVNTNTAAFPEAVTDFLLSPQQHQYQQPSNQMNYNSASHLAFLSSTSNFLMQQPQHAGPSSYQSTGSSQSAGWYNPAQQTDVTRVSSPIPADSLQTICLADIAEDNSRDSACNSSLVVKPLSAKTGKSKSKKNTKKTSVNSASLASTGHNPGFDANYGPGPNGSMVHSRGVPVAHQQIGTSYTSQPVGVNYKNHPFSDNQMVANNFPSSSCYNQNDLHQTNVQTAYTRAGSGYVQDSQNMLSHNPLYSAGYQPSNQSLGYHPPNQNAGYQTLNHNTGFQTYNTGYQTAFSSTGYQGSNYNTGYQLLNHSAGYQQTQCINLTGNHSGNTYNAVATGETKLRLQKVATASEQQNNLMDYWNVRKAGDCRLVFSTGVVGKRKAEELMSPGCPSPYDTPMSGYKYNTDDTQPQSKRRRCLVY